MDFFSNCCDWTDKSWIFSLIVVIGQIKVGCFLQLLWLNFKKLDVFSNCCDWTDKSWMFSPIFMIGLITVEYFHYLLWFGPVLEYSLTLWLDTYNMVIFSLWIWLDAYKMVIFFLFSDWIPKWRLFSLSDLIGYLQDG